MRTFLKATKSLQEIRTNHCCIVLDYMMGKHIPEKKKLSETPSHLLGHGPALNFSTCATTQFRREIFPKVKPMGKIRDLYGMVLLFFPTKFLRPLVLDKSPSLLVKSCEILWNLVNPPIDVRSILIFPGSQVGVAGRLSPQWMKRIHHAQWGHLVAWTMLLTPIALI